MCRPACAYAGLAEVLLRDGVGAGACLEQRGDITLGQSVHRIRTGKLHPPHQPDAFTAGGDFDGNNSGIGKQLWDYAVRVLVGTQIDDRLFALIHTIDPDDDPWDEASWIKGNPHWGQAVQPDAIRAIMRSPE